MPSNPPILHLMCGKAASGKSTLTAKLGQIGGTVIIAEDDWLNTLYPNEMTSLADYMRSATKLRNIMGQHIISLLNAGTSVVLDFQANTIASREWMRSILEKTNANHQLHLLDVPDDICIARLRARNAQADHPFTISEDQFRQLVQHFVAPSPDEGFNIITHSLPEHPDER